MSGFLLSKHEGEYLEAVQVVRSFRVLWNNRKQCGKEPGFAFQKTVRVLTLALLCGLVAIFAA